MSGALDRFLDHYCRRRPVNATFTGMHGYDDLLPDWSPIGLEALDDEMRGLTTDLGAAYRVSTAGPGWARARRDDADLLDAELARAFLEIQLAENASAHGVRGNPALWSGEAVFAVVALMIRQFAPLNERMVAAAARLEAIPAFLAQARETIGNVAIPPWWTARAQRECAGAMILLERGIPFWLGSGSHERSSAARLSAAAQRAHNAFYEFAEWLNSRPAASDRAMACGPDLYNLLLARGHQCSRPRGDLLTEARDRFVGARSRLDSLATRTAGSWAAAQERLAADHPTANDYLGAFGETWVACHERAVSNDVVTWPEWPIRYVPYPEWTRDAAPYLYYLHYRAPAPFDSSSGEYDYVVAPLPLDDPEPHLRAWNRSVIKLNHVVHHGAIGHHVQNWHAYHRSRSRIGQIAAVDCASRIGMFSGGTMAEGWACYATELMDELDFLTPLERVAQQHSRVRMLARAIVDIQLHDGTMSSADAVRFYAENVGMSADAARGEVVKNSMFPCTAVMYWLGTQGILDLRETVRRQRGAAFSLKSFHDELLGYGSIPVPLVARLITEDVP